MSLAQPQASRLFVTDWSQSHDTVILFGHSRRSRALLVTDPDQSHVLDSSDAHNFPTWLGTCAMQLHIEYLQRFICDAPRHPSERHSPW